MSDKVPLKTKDEKNFKENLKLLTRINNIKNRALKIKKVEGEIRK